jgi:hypothetical protein
LRQLINASSSKRELKDVDTDLLPIEDHSCFFGLTFFKIKKKASVRGGGALGGGEGSPTPTH